MSEKRLTYLDGAHAVLGVDIVGFSRLGDKEQLQAVQNLINWIRRSLRFFDVEEGQYRWSPAGDGGYLTFGTSDGCKTAVGIGLAILKLAKESNWRPATGAALELKLALHAGTVAESAEFGRETNMWGEGLNTAERILSICAPSQLLVSQPYYDLFLKGKSVNFSVGEFHYRTVKHGLQVVVMNVFQHDVGLSEQQATSARWRAVGLLWARTTQEYGYLIEDSLHSSEAVPALAAARFLLNLEDREAAYRVCCQIGRSDKRPWPQYRHKQFSIFDQMPPDVLMKVIEASAPRSFKKGETLCEEGDPATSFFFVVAGTIAVRGSVNKPLDQGAIIGEFSLWIPGIKRTAPLTAVEDSLVLEIKTDRFCRILSETPAVAEDIYKIIKDRIIENVLTSTRLFPGLGEEIKTIRSTLPLICEKLSPGSVLDLGSFAYVLFTGKVEIEPEENLRISIEAFGRIGDEQVVGIICDHDPVDGRTAKVLEETVAVVIPHKNLRDWQRRFRPVRDAWNSLCGIRLATSRRALKDALNETEEDGESTTNNAEAPMKEDEFRKLQAKVMALNRSLQQLNQDHRDGFLDDGRHVRLSTTVDSQRMEILLKLQDLLKGKDAQIDAIVSDAIEAEGSSAEQRNQMEPELMARLAIVAKEKNLGQSIVDRLNEHKGTVVSWLVEIGLAIAKRMGQ